MSHRSMEIQTIEQLVKYAQESWATLDHNENELLVSRLSMAIDAVVAVQKGQEPQTCECGAVGMFDGRKCAECGVERSRL